MIVVGADSARARAKVLVEEVRPDPDCNKDWSMLCTIGLGPDCEQDFWRLPTVNTV